MAAASPAILYRWHGTRTEVHLLLDKSRAAPQFGVSMADDSFLPEHTTFQTCKLDASLPVNLKFECNNKD